MRRSPTPGKQPKARDVVGAALADPNLCRDCTEPLPAGDLVSQEAVTQLPVAVLEIAPLLRQEPLLHQISDNLFSFQDTCAVYLVRDGDRAIAIDFGAGEVLDGLEEAGIEKVTDVLVTHHHRDQVQGLQRAVDAGARIWVPLAEQALVSDVEAHWQARPLANNYNNRQDRFSLLAGVPVSGPLSDYTKFSTGSLSFEVIPTPGHTVGSITLLAAVDGRRVAFSGDLIAGPGKVWSLAATQWSYNGAEGVATTIASLLDLRDRRPDLLLPSHGTVISSAVSAIDLTVDRLRRLLELRREPSGIEELRAHPYERITPHLLRNRTSHATSYVLLSSSGRALMIDFGYDFSRGLAAGTDRGSRRPWLYTLDALRRQHAVTAVEAVIPTHYHDDHVAGCNLLRQAHGTQVWAAESFSDVLASPESYDLPCLWYEPIAVDRRLPTGVPIPWQEYVLTLHEQPGHTRYAVAVEVTVDGSRVLFIGDQMGHTDGLDLNYVYAGDFRIDDYVRSAQLYRRLKPELLLSGHWGPRAGEASHIEEIGRRAEELAALHRELLPLDELDLEAGGPVARVYPYQQRALAGRAFDLTVEVRNPSPQAHPVTVALAVKPGWLVQPGEVRLKLAQAEHGWASFKVVAPAGQVARRARIGVELTVGTRRLGQLVEALVDLS
jgi:glyoxylase-like metal-dependent hydrolase (beta-lactamase superfamily II)